MDDFVWTPQKYAYDFVVCVEEGSAEVTVGANGGEYSFHPGEAIMLMEALDEAIFAAEQNRDTNV